MTVILCLLAAAIVIVLGLALTRPAQFRYERRIFISAAPDKIHPYMNDVVKANDWSPWMEKDPNVKMTYSGPTSGVGAIAAWDGNNQIGAGRLEIVGSTPEKITLHLEFLRPMKATNSAEYTLTPKDGGTEVGWAMYGPNTFAGRIFSVFVDCEKMIGKEFDKGLQKLKALIESN